MVHTLHPGDVVVAEHGHRLETLLGSCVAVLLTDPRRTIGAMCHIVHSKPASGGAIKSGAHAETALRLMCEGLVRRGIAPRLCKAWVFGGGNMFPEMSEVPQVGDQNAAWATAALAREGIEVLDRQLGGPVYRRVSWTVGSGMPRVHAVPVQGAAA